MTESGRQSLQWLPWDESAFQRSRESDRPILLTIVASWCRHCRDLDEQTFADPEIVRRVHDAYVPVRVDKDRRPDVNARYNCGGWPTIAFLTPDGDLIAGETFLTAAELAPILDRVAPFFHEHRHEIHAKVEELEEIRLRSQERRDLGPLGPAIVEAVGASVLESFDAVHGGFGTGSKFPHPEAIDFALVQFTRHGDERMRDVVVQTLDRMAQGEIYDGVEGGFFRYAQSRDWRLPHTEKVLDSNSARLRFYLEAHQIFGTERYQQTARGILGWLEARLLDSETHCFFGSQDADPEFYGLPIERRRSRTAPRVDRTIYADWNANCASALFLAAVVLDQPRLRTVASGVVDFILDEMFDETRGIYHYWDGTFHLPGLLSDQAYVLRALADAAAHTGSPRYLRAAESLVGVLRTRHMSPAGGFYDLPHDASDMKHPVRRNRSILENSILAEAFARLGSVLRDESLQRSAREVLDSFTGDFRQYGYYAAGYARAVDRVLHPTLQVTVVGTPGEPRAEALRLAALRRYIPDLVVDALDPVVEPERLEACQLPAREEATAFLTLGRASYAEVTDPADMDSVLSMADRDRPR